RSPFPATPHFGNTGYARPVNETNWVCGHDVFRSEKGHVFSHQPAFGGRDAPILKDGFRAATDVSPRNHGDSRESSRKHEVGGRSQQHQSAARAQIRSVALELGD